MYIVTPGRVQRGRCCLYLVCINHHLVQAPRLSALTTESAGSSKLRTETCTPLHDQLTTTAAAELFGT
jgi:hypothetical protein